MAKITSEMFQQATGHAPVDDDLERCNCKSAGNLGHFFCGWNKEENLPRFMTVPITNPTNQPKG